MSLLTVEGLTQAFGEKTLYENISFELYKGEHMGVVGQNGTGKSTLVRLLLGELTANDGRIVWQKNVEIGHIDQYAEVDRASSILAYLRTAYAPLYRAEEKLNALYAQMGADTQQTLLNRAAKYQQQLIDNDFYTIDSRIAKVAGGLGLAAIGMERPLSTLSGGQRTRVMLAKLLLGSPGVLLLDEPTNFLDGEHITWLGDYLADFEGTTVIVSHDFDFLNRVTTCILDIENRQVNKYFGSYADFVRQKKERREAYARAFASQQRQVEKLEDYIARNKARASTARMAKSRQKQLDRMEKLPPPSTLPTPHIAFPCLPMAGQVALNVKRLSIGYTQPLLPPLSFKVHVGDKLAIIGFNGIGKSTLMKTLAGQLAALGGSYTYALQARIAYFQQDLQWEGPELTPLGHILLRYPKLTPKEARRALARCGVSNKHALQPLASLSGGEQNKVKLCEVTLTPGNILLLDEPTNHLDAETKASLHKALETYPGTVLLVSHEEAFYKGLAQRVLNVEKLLE